MPRATMLRGLRSIFTVLKGRKLVFVNPTARIGVNEPEPVAPQPVDLGLLRANLHSGNPVKAALSGLPAFHAVRIRQLRLLLLRTCATGACTSATR